MSKKKLFQILLPLYNPAGEAIAVEYFQDLKEELTGHFGGLTTYSRAPATGVWKNANDDITVDKIIVYEVVAESHELSYWTNLKARLEKKFDQDEILIRCSDIEII
jgi:hypothetical protein